MTSRKKAKAKALEAACDAGLRTRAEETAHGKTAQSPEGVSLLSPDDARQMLHELQVHQIELEMQNEELREAQGELDVVRARYFDLYDLAPVGYITLSAIGLILEANFTAATLLGVSRDRLVKQPISRFILREDHDLYYHHRKQFVETAEAQSYDLRMLRQEGTHFWAHLQAVIVRDGEGEPVYRVVMSDITGRKQAEDALRDSEERFRLLVEDVTDYAIFMLAPDGTVTTWNLGAERLKGYHAEEIVGRHVSVFYPPDDVRAGKPQRELDEAAEKGQVEDEGWRMRKGGARFWANVVIIALRDEAGRLRGFGKVTRDMTGRKQAEAALRENEQRLQLFIDHAPAALAMLDRDMRYLSASRRWKNDFGLGERDLRGLSHYEVFPEIPERWREIHRRALAGEVLRADMDRFVRADGSVQWIRWEVRPWDNPEGNIGGIVIFSEDLSDIKRGEEALREMLLAKQVAEQANAAKAVFLANMSHELRTPLNAILGFSRLMRNAKDITAEQMQNLDIINRSGEYLLTLINNVLDLSRIESGRMELKQIHFDLHQLLHEIRSLMYVQAAEKRVTLILQPPSALPRQVTADEDKLRQVLINLVGNAIKFTEGGSVTLRAELVRQASQQAWVRFEVEDSGPGISEQDRERVFIPFAQLRERSPTEAGTGLGLSISKQYVELMGGQIGVTSEPGKGAVFHFEIPLRVRSQSDEVAAGSARGRVAGLAPGQRSYRLLIAEDQPDNRLLLRKLLEPLGFELREAVNGREAVALAEQWHPHLVWMDIRLPEMDGLEATRQIKARMVGINTKIVAITAHALDDERREILAAGCDDFIRKPYRDTEIFEALEKNLGVRFIYTDDCLSAGAIEDGDVSVAQLRKLPPDLLDELRRAAELLDGQRCLDIAGRIGVIDHELGACLRRMVKDLQFKELLALLDSFMTRTAA